jgi:hypothetical protein
MKALLHGLWMAIGTPLIAYLLPLLTTAINAGHMPVWLAAALGAVITYVTKLLTIGSSGK